MTSAQFSLLRQMTKRAIFAKYKGSILGFLWSFITPLFYLAVYTFVFGFIFKAKWPGISEDATTTQFALILFMGLSIHQYLAETLTLAPNLILSNQNYVKKVVFPLEILTPVTLGVGLFNMCISFGIILILMPFIFGEIPLSAIYLPLIFLPLSFLILGIAWFVTSLGVFARDVGQLIGPLVMAALFLAPIFFPVSALPEWLRPWIKFNPITIPVEQTHSILVFGHNPNFIDLGIYTIISLFVMLFGYYWFQKTRKGFADVL